MNDRSPCPICFIDLRLACASSFTGLYLTEKPSPSTQCTHIHTATLAGSVGTEAPQWKWPHLFPLQPASRVPALPCLFQNVSKGLADRKQNDQRKVSQGRLTPRCPTVEKSKETAIDQKENCDPLQCPEATPKGPASGIGSGGKMALNSPQPGPAENELGKALLKTAKEGNPLPRGPAQGSGGVAPLSPQGKGTAGEPTGSKFGSKAELRPPASRPPLQRGVSWDSGPEESGPRLQKVLAKLPLAEEEKRFSGKAGSKLAKAPGLKDFQIQVQPVRMQKLSKLREVSSWGPAGQGVPWAGDL